MKKIFFLILTLYCSLNLQAQIDTLRESELPDLYRGFNKSTIANFQKAYKYSIIDDSNTASKYLLMTNPYYLVWEWRGSKQPDTFLSKINITEETRNTILRVYDSTINIQKSEVYKTFEEMAVEDQELRKRHKRCGDTFTCRKIGQMVRAADSSHFAYLHNYVEKYGWPTIENGSMNATLLAIHDHARHDFYMPYLKDAVLKGQVDIGALKLINEFLRKRMSFDHEMIKKMIATKSHLVFDVSEILIESLPNVLPRIQKAFSDGCKEKFEYYYLFNTPHSHIMSDWIDIHMKNHTNNILYRFQKELQPFCPIKMVEPDIWTFSWFREERTSLLMILIYD